jgi:hypothetical protein
MLYPIETKTGWGYINEKGKIVVEPNLEWAIAFNDGMAPVKKNGKFGYINIHGELVIDYIFSSVDKFFDGVARVSQENEDGSTEVCINEAGEVIVPSREGITEFHRFSEGYGAIKLGGLYGFMNKSGEIVIEPKFEKVNWFKCGLAQIHQNNKIGFIDKKGRIVIEPTFSYGYSFTDDGLAPVALGITVDEDGIIHDDDARWGFIDTNGKQAIDMKFIDVLPFSEGLAAVQPLDSDFYGFINKRGELVIPAEYELAGMFNEGLAAVRKDDLWGFINLQGAIVIDFQFSEKLGSFFNNGIFLMGHSEYINRDGDYIWKDSSTSEGDDFDSDEEQLLSPEEYLEELAADNNMNIDEFKMYIKKKAIEQDLLDEDEEWFDEMPENDLVEWIITEEIGL